jgi:DNA polymerase III delta subunit
VLTDLAAHPPVVLIVGPEELLADRAVASVVAATRSTEIDAEVRDLAAATLEPRTLSQLTSPSLFGGRPVVIVRGAHDASADVIEELKHYVSAPADDATVVLVHGGGPKGKALLDAARSAGVHEIECAKITRFGDLIAFVRNEFRMAGRAITEAAARQLLDAVGRDLRDLAGACSQLVADTEGRVDEETVRIYYAGRAEATSFNVADAAVEGRAADALEQLRWAMAVGVAPVLVTSALAQGLRNIARVATAPRGGRQADLIRELGLPPWKIDRVRQQLRGWSGDGVAQAIQAVARADADIKGGGDDPAYALERVVLAVAAARHG